MRDRQWSVNVCGCCSTRGSAGPRPSDYAAAGFTECAWKMISPSTFRAVNSLVLWIRTCTGSKATTRNFTKKFIRQTSLGHLKFDLSSGCMALKASSRVAPGQKTRGTECGCPKWRLCLGTVTAFPRRDICPTWRHLRHLARADHETSEGTG